MPEFRFLRDIRETIPDFEFSSCGRIVRFDIFERESAMDAELDVSYLDKRLIRFRAESVSKLTLSFSGRRIELGEPLISMDENGICIHDELGHAIVMWCSDLQLLGVEACEG